ncbi:MAG: right-handed parallel beta-helix repeat-containing protein, partial [Bacteroidetes bacterium]|nr:right-handed parallel beta-helix repeat-containing protein [Bacteroidota bacterium]
MKNKIALLFLSLVAFAVKTFGTICTDVKVDTVLFQAPAVTCEDFPVRVIVHNYDTTGYTNVPVGLHFHLDSTLTVVPNGVPTGVYHVYTITSLPAGASDTIDLVLNYGCLSINQFALVQIFSTTVPNYAGIYFGGSLCDSTLFQYALSSPSLSASVPPALYAFPGNISRTLKITNSGAGYFEKHFTFRDSLDATAATFMHITGADVYIGGTHIGSYPMGTPGDSISIIFNPISDTLFPGDSLRIIEHFFVFGCPVGSTTHMQYYWGCDSCRSDSFNLSILITNPTANVQITRLLPDPDISHNLWDASCVNEIVHWKYQLVNNGSGYNNAHVLLSHKAIADQPFYTYVLSANPYPITCSRVHTDSIVLLKSLPYYTSPDTVNCLQQYRDAVFYVDMSIGYLSTGDTFYVDFYTVRCCANDEDIDSTATAEFDLFNRKKYFNHWTFQVRGEDNCGHAPSRISNGVSHSLFSEAAISSHAGFSDDLPDLSMSQEYYPEISDMSIPPNDTLPPSQHCDTSREFMVSNLQFDDFSRRLYDQQLFQGTDSMAPTGRFRVILQFQPGLHFDSTTTHAPYMVSALLGYIWHPTGSFTAITSPAGNGEAWEGFFDFDTTNFSTYVKLMTMMNFSQFHFWMRACCDAQRDPVKFDVKFYLDPLPKPSCNDCYVPMTRTAGNIHIHCPGCITPGIETTSFSLFRLPYSYGMKDGDNDGLADVPVQQISQVDTVALSHIRRNASVAGDGLVASMHGMFHDGANTTAHNLTYNAYLTSGHTPFKYIYFEQIIGFSDSARFDLTLDSVRLTIQSAYCVCNISYKLHSYEIIRHDSSYFYRIVVDSIPGYTIKEDDEFDLIAYFTVCNNYLSGTLWDADKNRFDADPIGCMYFSDTSLSGVTYFHHPANIFTAGDGYDLLCDTVDADACTFGADSLNPNWLYFCGASGSTHRFYSIRTSADIAKDNMLNASPCDKTLTFSNVAAIGGLGANVFPFEYRSAYDPAYVPVPQFHATIPAGYYTNRYLQEIDYHTYLPGCAYRNEHNEFAVGYYPLPLTGSLSFSIPHFDIATESIPLSLDSVCTPLHSVNPNDTFYIGDEYFKEFYTIFMYPDCAVQTCSTTVTNISISYTLFGCNLHDTTVTFPVDSLSMPYVYSGTNSCMIDTQLLSMSPPNPVTVASQRVKINDIQLQVYQSPNPNICIASPNTWIFIPDTGFLDNMMITCTTYGCPLYLDTVAPNASGFFQLGDLQCGLTCNYDLIADYVRCEGAGDHSLPIYYGWNCGPSLNSSSNRPDTDTTAHYPPALGLACGQYPADSLHVVEAPIDFISHDDLSYTEPSTFVLCDTTEIEECVRSNQGGINNLLAYINLHDTLLHLDTASVQLYYFSNTNHNQVSPDSVSPGIYSVDLSAFNSFLSATSHQLDSGKYICIRYKVIPVCGYSNLQMPEVNFGGIAFCGDSIPPSVGDTLAPWHVAGDSCGCPAMFTVDAGTDNLLCDSNCVTLEATITGSAGGMSYMWTPGPITGANPTVCPHSTTTYIVAATDTTTGTTATDSVTVNVISTTLGCCIPDKFISGTDFNFSSIHSSSLGYNIISTSNIILINDTFFVDSNFTFQGCSNVVLGPNAVIWLTELDTLNIFDSHFYACSDLWNEINVRPLSTIYVNSSRIENSKQAIYCDGGASITVLGSTFNQNYFDIKLVNPAFNGWYVTIERDSFICTQTLKYPLIGNRTSSHIHIFGVPPVINIGSSTFGNYFENADFGIYAEKSQPYIYNNTFFNFQPFNGTTHSYGVVGNNNKNMYVGDFGIANNFEQCETGVSIGNCSSYVLDNTFIKSFVAITSVFNLGRVNYINNNHISNVKNGIISLWNPYSTTEILGNDIATDQPDSGATNYGIYVGDWSFLGPSGINRVLKNTISSQSSYGIYSNSIKGVEIADNTIMLDHLSTPLSTYYGIRSDNCGKGFYNHNCVYRSGSKQNLRGITFIDSPNSSIYCNTTDGTDFGIQLYSNCDQSRTKGNTMVNHHQALVLGNPLPPVGGVMGDQLHFIETPDTFVVGNYYNNNSVGSMTYNLNILAQIPPRYEVQGGADYPFPNFSLFGPPINILFYSTTPYNLCPDCATPADGHPDDKKMSLQTAEETAQDTMTNPDEGDMIWKKKKALFEELKTDSSFTDSSTILETYFDTTITDAIGKLTEVKEVMLAAQDTSIDSTTKVNRIATAVSKNNSVSPSVSPEANEKALNEIYLNTFAKGIYELNSSQMSIVEGIANQCPFTGGNAVFVAWNIIHTFDPSRAFNDSILCNGYSMRKAHSTNALKNIV